MKTVTDTVRLETFRGEIQVLREYFFEQTKAAGLMENVIERLESATDPSTIFDSKKSLYDQLRGITWFAKNSFKPTLEEKLEELKILLRQAIGPKPRASSKHPIPKPPPVEADDGDDALREFLR